MPDSKQIIRLAYTSETAFQDDASGKNNLSAFILDPTKPPAIGLHSGGNFHYIKDRTADVNLLKSTVSTHAYLISSLAGQVGAVTGPTRFGSTVAPRGNQPLTFPVNSNYGGTVFNELLYLEHFVDDADDNITGIDNVFMFAAHRAYGEDGLWIRTRNGGSDIIYDLYASEIDATYESDRLAVCTTVSGSSPAIFPFLDEGDGMTVWGYFCAYEGIGTFAGDESITRMVRSTDAYCLPFEKLTVRGAKVRIPFRFTLSLGSTTSESIMFSVSMITSEGTFTVIEDMEFPLINPGSQEATFFGDVIVEHLGQRESSPPPTRWFRSWIELRGPDPTLSPISPLSIPVAQETYHEITLYENYRFSFGFRCDDGGGTELGGFGLWAADAIYEPPAASLLTLPEAE